jgi:hypothetical protein
VEKSVSADSAKLNTTEKIQLSLISGLDRKIRVTVKKGDVNVYSTTTESVKVADRIKSSSDEEFYGKVITMPPLSDGLYTITSEILNTQDALIDSTTQSFLIDTSGPTADNMRIDQRPGYDMVLTGNLWELGLGAEAKLYVTVKNVKATAGFDKATIQILNPDNTVYSKWTWFTTAVLHRFLFRGLRGARLKPTGCRCPMRIQNIAFVSRYTTRPVPEKSCRIRSSSLTRI